MVLEKNIQEKIIDDKILSNLTLTNIYEILNENVFPFLNEEEQKFVTELEQYCIEIEPKIDFDQDAYKAFPLLGAKGYMQRMNPYKDYAPNGMIYEVLLGMVVSILDPELDLARLASGILLGNPCYLHADGRQNLIDIYNEIQLCVLHTS